MSEGFVPRRVFAFNQTTGPQIQVQINITFAAFFVHTLSCTFSMQVRPLKIGQYQWYLFHVRKQTGNCPINVILTWCNMSCITYKLFLILWHFYKRELKCNFGWQQPSGSKFFKFQSNFFWGGAVAKRMWSPTGITSKILTLCPFYMLQKHHRTFYHTWKTFMLQLFALNWMRRKREKTYCERKNVK